MNRDSCIPNRVRRLTVAERQKVVKKLMRRRTPKRLAKSLLGAIHDNEVLWRKLRWLVNLKCEGRDDLVRTIRRRERAVRRKDEEIRRLERKVDATNRRLGYHQCHIKEMAKRYEDMKARLAAAEADLEGA